MYYVHSGIFLSLSLEVSTFSFWGIFLQKVNHMKFFVFCFGMEIVRVNAIFVQRFSPTGLIGVEVADTCPVFSSEVFNQ